MSVYQVGSLCSVEAYEALERYAGNDPQGDAQVSIDG